MNKKIIGAIAAIVIVAGIVFGINSMMPKKEAGAKEISIVIVDAMENKELYNGKVRTDTETLYELLVEKEELKAVFEDSSYGHYLVSLMDVEQGDINTGPWWLYESENNEACKSAGMCPGVDELFIKDADQFTFKRTNSFE